MSTWKIIEEIKAIAYLSQSTLEHRFEEIDKHLGHPLAQSLWTALEAIGDRAAYIQTLIEAGEDDRLPPPPDKD